MSRVDPKRIRVEVAYARRDEQTLVALELEEGATVGEAITRAGIAARNPGLVVEDGRVGIFGKPASLDARLRDGDRVEIYRPLTADPGEARRRRAGRRR